MKINYQNNSNQNYNEANYLENILEPNLINYNNSIVDLFMKYIENKNSILDFGAGSGALASIIRNRLNSSPICIEIDSKLIMSLKKKGFIVHKDITDLKEKFDLIYSSNVLEHIKDDVKMLEKIKLKLKENGTLALYLPAFMLLFSDLDTTSGHYRRYEKKDLIEKLDKAGFLITNIFFADSIGFIASLAIRMLGWNTQTGIGSKRSIIFYDKIIFPISKILDLLGFKFIFGKNIFVTAKIDCNYK